MENLKVLSVRLLAAAEFERNLMCTINIMYSECATIGVCRAYTYENLLSELSKLLRQLSSQWLHFKASSNAWELTFREIVYIVEYLTILERVKSSFAVDN